MKESEALRRQGPTQVPQPRQHRADGLWRGGSRQRGQRHHDNDEEQSGNKRPTPQPARRYGAERRQTPT
eukprot:8237333-Alexandrium_andersonii.AAC.1